MPGEEAGEPERVAVLLPYPERQRHQPPVEEEAGVRVQAPTEMVETVPDALDILPSGNHAARRDVVVSVQVFRSAVDRQVEAHLKGAEAHTRDERVVHHGEQIVLACEANNSRKVRGDEERLRQGLLA